MMCLGLCLRRCALIVQLLLRVLQLALEVVRLLLCGRVVPLRCIGRLLLVQEICCVAALFRFAPGASATTPTLSTTTAHRACPIYAIYSSIAGPILQPAFSSRPCAAAPATIATASTPASTGFATSTGVCIARIIVGMILVWVLCSSLVASAVASPLALNFSLVSVIGAW